MLRRCLFLFGSVNFILDLSFSYEIRENDREKTTKYGNSIRIFPIHRKSNIYVYAIIFPFVLRGFTLRYTDAVYNRTSYSFTGWEGEGEKQKRRCDLMCWRTFWMLLMFVLFCFVLVVCFLALFVSLSLDLCVRALCYSTLDPCYSSIQFYLLRHVFVVRRTVRILLATLIRNFPTFVLSNFLFLSAHSCVFVLFL